MHTLNVDSDIFPLIKHVVSALLPYAESQEVEIEVKTSSTGTFSIEHHPESLLTDLSTLLSRIITLTPQKQCVSVIVSPEELQTKISVRNSQVSLYDIRNKVLAGMNHSSEVIELEKGTEFKLILPGKILGNSFGQTREKRLAEGKPVENQLFSDRLQKHLSAYFSNVKKLEKLADESNPKEAKFLRKVNAILENYLDVEGFNADSLAKSVALSRSQLLRKLKPLTGQSTASYMRMFRLNKAKELLENEDLTVSEVAFRTGFLSPSHFSRAFREQYGFNPSELKNIP